MTDRATAGSVAVSIVSHGHAALVEPLLADLARCAEIGTLILTRNIPESEIPCPAAFKDRMHVIVNDRPRGFAANHNAAFLRATLPFFCILNPDVRLPNNPFPTLLSCFDQERVALTAPAIVNPAGRIEDSARQYPTPVRIVRKAIGGADGRLTFELGGPPMHPDWIAGMFMLARASAFSALGGFDDRFFLYYEDVDLCARLHRAGFDVILCPRVTAVHDARRDSRSNLRYLKWHAASMARYFAKHLWRTRRRSY